MKICHCGQPTVDGKKECQSCAYKHKIEVIARQEKLLKDGKCRVCGKPVVEGKNGCEDCLKENAKQVARNNLAKKLFGKSWKKLTSKQQEQVMKQLSTTPGAINMRAKRKNDPDYEESNRRYTRFRVKAIREVLSGYPNGDTKERLKNLPPEEMEKINKRAEELRAEHNARHRDYMEGMRHPKMGGKTFSRPGGTTAKDVPEENKSELTRYLDRKLGKEPAGPRTRKPAKYIEPLPEQDLTNIKGDGSKDDQRKLVWRKTVQRRMQPKMRKAILIAYQNVGIFTGSQIIQGMDCCHIDDHNGHNDVVENGFLAEKTWHAYFDRGIVGIDPDNWTIIVAEDFMKSELAPWHGRRVFLPKNPKYWPNKQLLNEHRKKFGL